MFNGSLVCKTSVLRTFNSCSTTTHHTPLIIHHSSYTTHHTPLIILVVVGAALCEPPCADFVAGAALCEPPRADFVAGTALCAPPCADFVAGAIQNALRRDSERTKCCIFQWNRWLRSWQVKVCGTTVARRSRVMLGSFSESSVHWD